MPRDLLALVAIVAASVPIQLRVDARSRMASLPSHPTPHVRTRVLATVSPRNSRLRFAAIQIAVRVTGDEPKTKKPRTAPRGGKFKEYHSLKQAMKSEGRHSAEWKQPLRCRKAPRPAPRLDIALGFSKHVLVLGLFELLAYAMLFLKICFPFHLSDLVAYCVLVGVSDLSLTQTRLSMSRQHRATVLRGCSDRRRSWQSSIRILLQAFFDRFDRVWPQHNDSVAEACIRKRLSEFIQTYGATAVRLWWEEEYVAPPSDRPQPKDR